MSESRGEALIVRDRGLLLVVAIALAAASWGFWHFLADDAFAVISTLILLSLLVDNVGLRQKLGRLERQQPPSSPQ